MPAPVPVPAELLRGPFTSRRARELGVSEKVLRGRRFRRLHPRVWTAIEHAMREQDVLRAAAMALPERARLSHGSRLRALGLQLGPLSPVHFTVQGELHLDLDGIVLHRTKAMPPCDDVGVTPASAFVQAVTEGRLIDVVARGEWLLHHGHVTRTQIEEIARSQSWRPGAAEARALVPGLDGRSASLPETRLRLVVAASGLPVPTPNVDLVDGDRVVARSDLVLPAWNLLLEYEGRQHLHDEAQWRRDLARYADLRARGWTYLQVTHEMLQHPRALVLRVHALLLENGYDGPPPRFGPRWWALFGPVSSRLSWIGDLASTSTHVVDADSPLRSADGR